MHDWKQALLRQLPSVDSLMRHEDILDLLSKYPHGLVLECVREVLEDFRKEVIRMEQPDLGPDNSMLISQIACLVDDRYPPNFRQVINATGVILHTNLGRAPMSQKAAEAALWAGSRYSNLEMNLNTGDRGSRLKHVEVLLKRLTGAEACLVVNNNAAAVLLALNTLAKDREVIVSRGQMVEIGGGFRIPEVMKQSGARLVEVGATNRTYLSDYQCAVTENTALLLKVHTSNYQIVGFASECSPSELADFGRGIGIPVMVDLGSGCLVDLQAMGIDGEPKVSDVVGAGVDIVTFSGDKLLGGPQAGIIAGREEYIVAMKINPLARALRIDKMTLAALEATLREYLWGSPEGEIPVLAMLSVSQDELAARGKLLQQQLQGVPGIETYLIRGESQAGGGALPLQELPTFLVSASVPGVSPEALAAGLRRGNPPVITLIRDDSVLFDVRTMDDQEINIVAQCLDRVVRESQF